MTSPKRLLPVVLLAASASAQTYVVDASGGPGADFTDIQSAIYAAPGGARILVRPGDYTAFTLFKPLDVLAVAEGVRVSGTSLVLHIQAGEFAGLAAMQMGRLELSLSPGTIVLDSIAGLGSIRARGCGDLRILRADVQATLERAAIEVLESDVELVACQLVGGRGRHSYTEWCDFCPNECDPGGPGFPAVLIGPSAVGGSRAILALNEVTGGTGGTSKASDGVFGCYGGPGGAGVRGYGGVSVLLVGGLLPQWIVGGVGGQGLDFQGPGGAGLRLEEAGTSARYSGSVFLGGPGLPNGAPISVAGGASAVPASGLEPSLAVSGAVANGFARLVVQGEAGDDALLYLGDAPRREPLPGVAVERLTNERRKLSLGTLGAGGNVTVFVPLRYAAQGSRVLFAQARILRSGQELRTNSVAILIR
jgi:hypothetical protein